MDAGNPSGFQRAKHDFAPRTKVFFLQRQRTVYNQQPLTIRVKSRRAPLFFHPRSCISVSRTVLFTVPFKILNRYFRHRRYCQLFFVKLRWFEIKALFLYMGVDQSKSQERAWVQAGR